MREGSSFLGCAVQNSCPREFSVVSDGYEGPVEGGGGGAASTQDKQWDCFCLGEMGTVSRTWMILLINTQTIFPS